MQNIAYINHILRCYIIDVYFREGLKSQLNSSVCGLKQSATLELLFEFHIDLKECLLSLNDSQTALLLHIVDYSRNKFYRKHFQRRTIQ